MDKAGLFETRVKPRSRHASRRGRKSSGRADAASRCRKARNFSSSLRKRVVSACSNGTCKPARCVCPDNFLSLYGLCDFDGRYQSWLECVFREDVPRLLDLVESAFAAHAGDMQAEFRIVSRRDGALKWMEARNLIFYGSDRRALRVVGVNVDVTERKRAAAQLRAFADTLGRTGQGAHARIGGGERGAKEGGRGAPPGPEDGSCRATHRWDRARFQQPSHRCSGQPRHDRPPDRRLGGIGCGIRIVRGRDMAAEGVRRAVRLTSRLLAFSRQQPLAPRPIDANKLVAQPPNSAQNGGGNHYLETALAAASGARTPTLISSRTRLSILPSTPATPCRRAAR